MSSDFLAGVSQILLNQVSSQVYPSIQSKLTQTSTIPSPAVTVTWAISQAPTFDLSQNSANGFNLNVVVNLTITPTGGTPTSESLSASGACTIAISSAGVLSFMINNLSFTTTDPFVQQILAIKKQDIIATLDNLLQTIQIPIGPVESITFNGYTTGIQNSVLYVGASISGSTSIDQTLATGNGFAIALSNTLMQNIVNNLWWATTQKSFYQDDVTMTLDNYSFNISGSSLELTLGMGGGAALDCGFLGTARWDLDYTSAVTADINLSIDQNRNVNIDGGSVSHPIVIPVPANFLAGVSTVGMGPIVLAVATIVFTEMIPSAISGHLNGTMFTIPVISSAFQGINFSITPTDLNLAVSNNEVIVTGNVTAIAS